jgi:serine/threonine kinase 3
MIKTTNQRQILISKLSIDFSGDCKTLVPGKDCDEINDGTLVPDSGTMVELQSNLGTMVINSDPEESTMKSMRKKKNK